MRSLAKIESIVRRLLEEQGIDEPAVSVETIAKSKNAKVQYEQFDDGVSGALYRSDSIVVIGVNKNHPRNRQRFTLAHEVAHLLLHKEELFVDHHYVGVPSTDAASATMRRLFRDTASSQAINPNEIEANRFAAALLMPRHFLDQSLSSFRGPLGEEVIGALAKEYQVSQQAMLFRLMNLGAPVDPA